MRKTQYVKIREPQSPRGPSGGAETQGKAAEVRGTPWTLPSEALRKRDREQTGLGGPRGDFEKAEIIHGVRP